ncbi:Glycosyltransferase [Gracilaria domingensis]|nr:Glycosyltransferase [Gracilaria domingensis]
MHVVFIHPDLGIGGAERFIVDAALSLQKHSHQTTIFTPHFDPTRCFNDVAPSSASVHVRCINPFVPRSILGRFQAILTSLRCALVALYVCLFCQLDVAVVDIVSFPLLILSLFRVKSVFYCHYPDKLLAKSLDPSSRPSLLKRIYRFVIDAIEAFALRHATRVVCNSRFTTRAFTETFPNLPKPTVIYPCVKMPEHVRRDSSSNVLLSLNRFERKKNISLAIDTLSYLISKHNVDITLVIAGGYDTRLTENVQYYEQLEQQARSHGLQNRVKLLKNVSDAQRRALLHNALVVLYTPANEHFGIVPLEAMSEAVPIVAVNSGGPLETVEHLQTGFLCDDSAQQFGDAVMQLFSDHQQSVQMGEQGRERVNKYFSMDVLGRELHLLLTNIIDT